MNFKMLYLILFVPWVLLAGALEDDFIITRDQFELYANDPNIIVVASSGRSGSTMLKEALSSYFPREQVLKMHLLPPSKGFKGKFVFVFSNPDKAAESAFHLSFENYDFGSRHFMHMETADLKWLNEIGDTLKQTLLHNLLAYDALGCYQQLEAWLYVRTKPSSPKNAQVLAVKYEHLWESETMCAIQAFLGLESLIFPPFRARGCSLERLSDLEREIRTMYNLGTPETPIYSAYDQVRALWESAPPYQFLKIVD